MSLFDDVFEYAQRVRGDISQIVTDVTSGWEDTAPTGTPTAVLGAIGAIRQAILGGYTVETLTSSGTWNKPAGMITEFWAIGIGGGGKGQPGQADDGFGFSTGGAGGLSGSYEAVQISPDDLNSTESFIVGAAASTNGAPGGATSFGSHMATTPGGLGGIASPQGYALTASRPGDGGKGGDAQAVDGSSDIADSGTAGGASALAAGGAAGVGNVNGNGTAGGAGGAASLTGPSKSGGGGGGGGGGAHRNGPGSHAVGGNGGNGGYPGGASGGGGAARSTPVSFTDATGGQPGTPANGVLFLVYKVAA